MPHTRKRWSGFGWPTALLLAILWPGAGLGAEVAVAVAANFRATLAALAPEFETATGHRLALSAGSTGQLYAQIVRGAPFDVFLAADQARPAALVDAGMATPGSQATYAEGRLYVLTARKVDPGRDALKGAKTVSIANPRTAPYGAAALQVIENMKLSGIDIAQAQSVAGVNAAVVAGAVDAGLAAYSSVAGTDPRPAGWLVPRDLHDPILQDAVLLSRAADNQTARAFLEWLISAETRARIRGWGYD